MAWELIDPNAVKVVEVQGVNVHIRPLSGADKASMALHWGQDRDGNFTADLSSLLPYLAKAVVKIEGFENMESLEVLERLDDAVILSELTTAIMSYSALTEDQAKNSGSSSAGSAATPAGEPE